MKVAAYARVSTADKGQDTENQLVPIRATAANRGWTITEEYVDHGISGTKESRPALDKLLNDARHGRFQVVIIAAFDRMARSSRHMLNLIFELQSVGVQVVSLRDALDLTTPQGRMMLTVLAGFAQLERDLISERVRTAIAAKRASAERCGRTWKHGRPRTVTDDRAEQIRTLRASGSSIREIAKAVGLSPTAVQRVLKP
jgi:DNA invertase Pin-like site-specific DNA recombinase